MKTPYEKYLETTSRVPLQGEVTQNYWDSPPEKIVPRNTKYLTWVKDSKMSHLSCYITDNFYINHFFCRLSTKDGMLLETNFVFPTFRYFYVKRSEWVPVLYRITISTFISYINNQSGSI